jgi:hypothetical protein
MTRIVSIALLVLLALPFAGCAAERTAKADEKMQYVETETGRWLVHDMNRPAPPVVTPGMGCQPPSDAIALFDGKDLSKWTDTKGRPAKWRVRDDYAEVVKDSGSIKTKQGFGSCQLHIEFATPEKVKGHSQERGNSGVYFMSNYEVQVLDSYNNKTYPDGQCAALYGRAVPLVNACRGPGLWQSYDIIFHRPIFKGDEVVKKATFTVLHNGVLVHDHVQLEGTTDWRGPHAIAPYRPHKDKLPLMLQDHGNPVRYRNIWIRELRD